MPRFALVLLPLLLLLTAACTPHAPVQASPPGSSIPDNPLERPPPMAPVTGGPASPDTRCKIDADCTVKNVGNCCGYYPACVNINAKVDPEAVAAECRKTGMAGVCGFPSISACTCSSGQCTADSQIRSP
ncbi:MAG: hypothetical protein Q4G62_09875 [Pseudomonadota bacterium]|nr:hypothetical protein [Pseudomonadota bacterium]